MLEIESHGKRGTFRGVKATESHFKHVPLSLQSTHPLAWELQVIRPERSSHLTNFRGKLLGCVLSLEEVLKRRMRPERDRTIGALLTNSKAIPPDNHSLLLLFSDSSLNSHGAHSHNPLRDVPP